MPSLFQQPGKLNLKAYSNVTDAIGKINIKDGGLLTSKLTKGGSVHAPLATPENMDLGPDYAAVSTLIFPVVTLSVVGPPYPLGSFLLHPSVLPSIYSWLCSLFNDLSFSLMVSFVILVLQLTVGFFHKASLSVLCCKIWVLVIVFF